MLHSENKYKPQLTQHVIRGEEIRNASVAPENIYNHCRKGYGWELHSYKKKLGAISSVSLTL